MGLFLHPDLNPLTTYRISMSKFSLALFSFLFCQFVLGQTLVINEVSNGPTGTKEWVELLVYDANPDPCANHTLDLRGWIIDDNNGYFGGGSGTGIANGCIRFANDPLWSAVPVGTLITIYNNADIDPALNAPANDDQSLNDGNCVIQIPVNSNLLEGNANQPSQSNNNYPTSGFTSGSGSWGYISMSNSNDSFQTRDANNLSTPAHAVSYGNNTSNNIIYFAGSGGGNCYYMNDSIGGDWYSQSNWASGSAGTVETPSSGNSNENTAAIGQMNNNCSATTSFTMNVSNDTTICEGSSVTISAAGATSYTWDNGLGAGDSHTISPSSTTLYKVTGTSGSCIAIDSVLVTVEATPNLSVSNDTAICSGNSANLIASGASSYFWDNGLGAGNHTVSPSATTLYKVVGTTGNCSAEDSVLITIYQNPDIQVSNDTTVCQGDSVTMTATGFPNPVWNQSLGNGNSKTVAPDTTTLYVVLAQDNNSCQDLDSILITVNPTPSLATSNDTTVCSEESVVLTVTGANTYAWNNGLGTGSTHTVQPNTTTQYLVQGTGTNGCINTDSVLVTVLSLPTIDAGPDQSICDGSSTSVSASGGNNYTWNNGVTDGVSFSPNTTATYVVVGDGANGCTGTDSLVIQVLPDLPVFAGNDTAICEGASITLTGQGAVNYSWNNGVTDGVAFTPTSNNLYIVTGTDNSGCSGVDSIQVNILSNPSFTTSNDTTICFEEFATIAAYGPLTFSWDNGLGNGSNFSVSPFTDTEYHVIGTDGNGCSSEDSVLVSVLSLPTVNAGPDQGICAGTSTSLSGSGAVSYSWNNGVSDGVTFTPTQTDTFVVTGTDGNGCSNIDSVVVEILPDLPVEAGNDTSICDGQTILLNATGAQNYSWNNGGLQGIAFVPSNTTTYTVIGTDNAGCEGVDSITVTVLDNPIIATSNDTNICFGQSANISASGASSYLWNNGVGSGAAHQVSPQDSMTYQVTGTDGNGCSAIATVFVGVFDLPNVSAGADQTICDGSSTSLAGSGALNYSWDNGISDGVSFTPTETDTFAVLGTDINGCENVDTAIINVLDELLVEAGSDTALCSGDFVTLTGSGAVNYNWSNGVSNNLPFSPPATQWYFLTGTDNSGCSGIDSVLVTVNPLPQMVTSNDTSICFNESVTLSVAGGDDYLWNNGLGAGASHTVQPNQSTTYRIVATNQFGCEVSDSILLTVHDLPNVSAGQDQELCEGEWTTVTASGALTYTWTGGVNNNQPFEPANNFDTLVVIGTDANNCQNTDSLTIQVNPRPTVDAGADTTLCSGEILRLAGSGALTYSWTGGIEDDIFFQATEAQYYYVTGTNAFGCTHTDSVFVNAKPLPDVQFNDDPVICLGESIELMATGADNYFWNQGLGNGASHVVSPPSTTTYVVVSTLNGCSTTDTLVLVVEPLPIADFDAQFVEPKILTNNLSQHADSYWWSISPLQPSTSEYEPDFIFQKYTPEFTITLIAYSDLGCSDTITKSFIAPESTEQIIYVPNSFSPNGDQVNDLFFPSFDKNTVKDLNLAVYNRWGQLIYSTNNLNGGWDGTYKGKDCQIGNYVWKMTFTEKGETVLMTGTVAIIR